LKEIQLVPLKDAVMPRAEPAFDALSHTEVKRSHNFRRRAESQEIPHQLDLQNIMNDSINIHTINLIEITPSISSNSSFFKC